MGKGFKAILHIEEDPEIRNVIKDITRGYFRNITRVDLIDLVQQAIENSNLKLTDDLRRITEEKISKRVEAFFGSPYSTQSNNVVSEIAHKIVEKFIQKYLTEEKIDLILAKVVQKRVDALLNRDKPGA